jgi:hypothetical protein
LTKNDRSPPVTFKGKTMETPAKQAKLTMPLQAWQEGVTSAQEGTNQPCPYHHDSTEAWAWSAGRIEGKAIVDRCTLRIAANDAANH